MGAEGPLVLGAGDRVVRAGAGAAAAAARASAAAAPAAAPPPPPAAPSPPLPADFVFDTDHPVLPVPFTAQIAGLRLRGCGLSIAAAHVEVPGPYDPEWTGIRQVACLQFDFEGFSVTLFPEVVVAGARRDGEITLQFVAPSGAHLPQLRHILNSHLAGDLVTLNGALAYTGPTRPRAPRPAETPALRQRLRSLAGAVLSLALIAAAGWAMAARAGSHSEPRPVFVERAGSEMRATAAGQIAMLNPAAGKGEVAFTLASNSGEVLSFRLPCACPVELAEGVFEGATVLPGDPVLRLVEPAAGLRMQALIGMEGLARVVAGDRAWLDLADGRSLRVRVRTTPATNAAALRGEILAPVEIEAPPGLLGAGDIGKAGRLRLQRVWLGASGEAE